MLELWILRGAGATGEANVQKRTGETAEIAGSAITQRSELVKQSRYSFEGRLRFFVFESDETAVACVAENFGNSREVSRLFFSADGDGGLNLSIDGPGGDDLHVPVGIIGLKIPTVEINTEPVGLIDTLNNLEHLRGGGGNATMIFEGQKDAAFCGVLQGFVDGSGTAFDSRLFGVTFGHLACKNADGWGTEDGSVVDPLSTFGELFVACFAGRKAEVISDGSCRYGKSLSVEQGAESEEVFVGDVLWEVVAGEFGGCETLFGAEGDELFEIHFSGGDLLGGAAAHHLAVEGISGKAEPEEGFSGSFGRTSLGSFLAGVSGGQLREEED